MRRAPLTTRPVRIVAVMAAVLTTVLTACSGGGSEPERQAAAAPDTATINGVICLANNTGHELLVGSLPIDGTVRLAPTESRCLPGIDDARDVIVGDRTTGRFDRMRFASVTDGQDTTVKVNGTTIAVPAGQTVDTGTYRFIRSAGSSQLVAIISTVTNNAGQQNPLETGDDAAAAGDLEAPDPVRMAAIDPRVWCMSPTFCEVRATAQASGRGPFLLRVTARGADQLVTWSASVEGPSPLSMSETWRPGNGTFDLDFRLVDQSTKDVVARSSQRVVLNFGAAADGSAAEVETPAATPTASSS